MTRRDDILDIEGREFPGRTYSEVVLIPAYENAKEHLLGAMIAVNKAHLIMLVEQSLLSKDDAMEIADAILHLDLDALRSGHYDGRFEDLFFEVEDAIVNLCGEKGGSLHLARSRNDMGVAMYRLTLRTKLQRTMHALLHFQQILLDLATEHVNTIMLGYTHTQQAQPTTVAHYLLAIFDSVSRDLTRLQSAYATLNKSPLGAAALTTSGFKINRHRVAQLLGFHGLVENSYDAIAGADYLGEVASAIQLTLTGIGRYVQDLLLWATQEFGAIRVADPYVQTSSIMPQKRNPVSLEHIRALSSSGVGSANTVLQMLHNTPFGDINDTEDDLQPHIWKSLALADEIFRLFGAVLGTMEVNQTLLLKRAKSSFASITELADTIVREANLPFRTAHSIASAVAKSAIGNGLQATAVNAAMVNAAALTATGHPLELPEDVVQRAMDPTEFVRIRDCIGGPAPRETSRAIEDRHRTLETNAKELSFHIAETTACLSTLDMEIGSWRAS